MKIIAWYLSKYNRNSLGTFIFLVIIYSCVGYYWRSIIAEGDLKDPLLWGIWAFMTAVLCWNIDAKRDLARIAVGFVGGLMIEAWGTQTNLWFYYTQERPPLWIIPAWPVSAIAIDRISRAIDHLFKSFKLEKLWWFMVIAFSTLMINFVGPSMHHWTSVGAFILVFVVFAIPDYRRQDMTLMLGGSLLGIFLEYWGTSRYCWTYYTREIPPIFAVFAHGMASIAFQRGAAILDQKFFKKSVNIRRIKLTSKMRKQGLK